MAEARETKWWGQSRTIWGAAITALSTVLPVVGPLIGVEIPAEVIRTVGDQVVTVVQAVGGIVGTALTVFGRMRATSQLVRREVLVQL
jgi:hypothetical protein